MTRIIGGFAGSRSLEVPRSGTRPTSDRVREAIFSALESRDAVEGARVLDLYAGSGALGLEAASRGAAAVTLVERDRNAAAIARRNVAKVLGSARAGGPGPQIEVAAQAVSSWLVVAAGTSWDVVFVDPPYELGETELAGVITGIATILAEDGELVVERSSRSPEPTLPGELLLARTKRYGETTVHWITRA